MSRPKFIQWWQHQINNYVIGTITTHQQKQPVTFAQLCRDLHGFSRSRNGSDEVTVYQEWFLQMVKTAQVQLGKKDITFSRNYINTFRLGIRYFESNQNPKMKHSYLLSGMTCVNCMATVKRRLSTHPGVTSVELNLDSQLAVIEMDTQVSTHDLQTALGGGKYKIYDDVTSG